MSFPRRKDLFTAWSKAMVEGATVDKPNYHGTKKNTPKRKSRKLSLKRRRRKRKNAKKKD